MPMKKKSDRERLVVVIVRMPPDLREALRKVAADQDRSMSLQCIRYIKRGMAEDEKA
jgi:hypothetical protein